MANRKTPSPFKVLGKWRAQVTLKNGSRPCKDFEKLEDAKQHIADALRNHNSEHDAKLDGPTQATLADALTYYAGVNTINKGGATAELNRINHYLEGAGRQPLRLETDEEGVKSVQETAFGRAALRAQQSDGHRHGAAATCPAHWASDLWPIWRPSLKTEPSSHPATAHGVLGCFFGRHALT